MVINTIYPIKKFYVHLTKQCPCSTNQGWIFIFFFAAVQKFCRNANATGEGTSKMKSNFAN